METQFEIEHKWDVAKLLITNMNYKMLLYYLPQYDLYVEKVSPIPVVYSKRPHGLGFHLQTGDPKQPHIVSVRAKPECMVMVAEFIRERPEFRAYRIFKHGLNFRGLEKKDLIGIICETTKNMLHLYPGKTFYITSKNKELRQLFYEKAVQINEEDNLGCSFDYDEYDYALDIRAYKRFKEVEYLELGEKIKRIVKRTFHRWAVVTILYGPDLPNKWNMEEI